MRFVVKIDTDNEAFAYEEGVFEVARILRQVGRDLEDGVDFSKAQTLHDVNGNDVGRAKWEEKYEDDYLKRRK